MKLLGFSPEARRDVIDIWTYISRRNLPAADRLSSTSNATPPAGGDAGNGSQA